MKQKLITPAHVLEWGSCERYTLNKLTDLCEGKRGLTPIEILTLTIPHDDRLWVVCRESVLPLELLIYFRAECAANILRLYEREYPNDSRPRNAIESSKAYALNPTAARFAAWAAARAAACAAACAAAGDAAWDAEREWQVNRLIEIIEVGW